MTNRKFLYAGLVVIIIVGALLLSCFFSNYRPNLINTASTKTITEDGAWCWFQDPRAVHYDGVFNKTYTGWVNKKGDIIIASYDHDTKKDVENVLYSGLQTDDHSAPSILIRNDGRIMVFYSAHVGKLMFYKISNKPEDISSWSEEMTLSSNTPGDWGYTYPNPVQLSDENGRIYLFWRGGNGEPTFATSLDNGLTWSDAQTLFNVPGERPYVKIFSDGKDRIYFTFTDGHPNEVDTNNIYFAYYQGGSFYKADGTFIKDLDNIPLLPADVDLVYNSNVTKIKAWNWDIAVDQDNKPIIVYATFPNINDHRYNYAYWNGKAWDNNEITSAGNSIGGEKEQYYSGGITLDHEDPSSVYISKEIGGFNEIQKWSTSNRGFDWTSKDITAHSEKENIRPIVPRNHSSNEAGLIWMYGAYSFYTEYNTSLKTQL
jgi:hypothetical protein